MEYKNWLSGLAIALTFYGFWPYIRSIVQGKTSPHVFSWIIWGITTVIVFIAQLYEKGGVGAWPTGVSGLLTFLVAMLAYLNKSDVSITWLDWAFFITALASLPFWYFTTDPLWAVALLTLVDVCGFGPTIRKVHENPYAEDIGFYALFVFRNGIAVAALENYTLANILFPVVVSFACVLLILLIVYMRKQNHVK